MVEVVKRLQQAGLILGTLGVLGFMGIVWLMIYGNLAGNLGFQDTTQSFVNQTINLTTGGNYPAAVLGKNNTVLSGVLVTNATSGALLPASNYSVVGGLVKATTGSNYTSQLVNVSASATFDSQGEEDANGVISFITAGFKTFFGFSNTFFTIAAIVVLITMFVGLIGLVVLIAKSFNSSGSKGDGFYDN